MRKFVEDKNAKSETTKELTSSNSERIFLDVRFIIMVMLLLFVTGWNVYLQHVIWQKSEEAARSVELKWIEPELGSQSKKMDEIRSYLQRTNQAAEELRSQCDHFENAQFEEAAVGFYLQESMNIDEPDEFQDLQIALRACAKFSSCGGVTGHQDQQMAKWTWFLRKGQTLLPSLLNEVTFMKRGRIAALIDSAISAIGHWPYESARVWDGPFADSFLEDIAGLSGFETTDLEAAKAYCIQTPECSGVTGTPSQHNNSDSLFIWQIRKSSDLSISQQGERSYRWRLLDPYDLCTFKEGSIHQVSCLWEGARGRTHLKAGLETGHKHMQSGNPQHDSLSATRVCLISLTRRSDRRKLFFENMRQRGVPEPLIRWFHGVDRRAYENVDEMVRKEGYAAVNWAQFEDSDYMRQRTTERMKGKVGAWLAHLNVWRSLSKAHDNATSWAIVMEDDVVLHDAWSVLLDKMEVTTILRPDTNFIYLIGREQPASPAEVDADVPGYVGVDAYAVRISVIPSLLRFSLLSSTVGRILALDDHLIALARMGVISVRTLWGGQAASNRMERTASDIEVASGV